MIDTLYIWMDGWMKDRMLDRQLAGTIMWMDGQTASQNDRYIVYLDGCMDGWVGGMLDRQLANRYIVNLDG